MNKGIQAVSVAQRPRGELSVEIKGSRPHLGKSVVAELIRRTLVKHGFSDVEVVSTDNDQHHFIEKDLSELGEHVTGSKVRIVDENRLIKPR